MNFLRSIVLLALVAPVLGQADDARLRSLLAEQTGFSETEFAALDASEIVVKPLPSDNKRETAVFGVVRIKDLREVTLAELRESLSQTGSDARKQGSKFSSPPIAGDLDAFEISDKDLKDLNNCKIYDCDLNLPAEWIKSIQQNAPWDNSRATELIREFVLERLAAYQENGNRSLGKYNNRRTAVDVAAEYRELQNSAVLIKELFPDVNAYIAEYPEAALPGGEDEFSWAIIEFGLKPVLTLSHAINYSRTDDAGPQHVLAVKQLYANHYLDASLAFTFLLRTTAEDGARTYLIFTDRSRSDALGGLLGSMARGVVETESAERVRNVLKNAELRLIAATRRETEPLPVPERGTVETVLAYVARPAVAAVLLAMLAATAFLFLRKR
jgi:hypothetical protein